MTEESIALFSGQVGRLLSPAPFRIPLIEVNEVTLNPQRCRGHHRISFSIEATLAISRQTLRESRSRPGERGCMRALEARSIVRRPGTQSASGHRLGAPAWLDSSHQWGRYSVRIATWSCESLRCRVRRRGEVKNSRIFSESPLMSDTGNVPRRNISFRPGRCPILVRQTIVQGRTPVPGHGRGQGRKMAAERRGQGETLGNRRGSSWDSRSEERRGGE